MLSIRAITEPENSAKAEWFATIYHCKSFVFSFCDGMYICVQYSST